MQFYVLLMLCIVGICCGLTPEHVKKFIKENQAKMVSVSEPSLQNVSRLCRDALNKTTVEKAEKYLDNIGKPASGLFDGNLQWTGNFGACLKMSGAQFCYSSIVIKLQGNVPKLPIGWGLCVPEECSETDVTYGLEEIVKELERLAEDTKSNVTVWLGSVQPDRHVACYKESTYSAGAVVTLTIIGVLILLSTLGTCWDIYESLFIVKASYSTFDTFEKGAGQDRTSPCISADDVVLLNGRLNAQDSTCSSIYGVSRKIFMAFSLLKNTEQIMSTKVPSNSITSINGIRVISMFWVILGHSYAFFVVSGAVDNTLDLVNTVHRFSFQPILNGFFSVDSFFFLSGLLVGYLGWRRMEKNDGKLPIFGFYFHRFWRLTPVYMFVILFFDKMISFLGKGPYWFMSDTLSTPCDKYWWTNLLYINNFYPKGIQDECLDWSWYLANDMQFYVISPVVLIAVYKFRWRGVAMSIGTMTGLSIIVTAAIMAHYNLDAVVFTDVAPAAATGVNYFDSVYIKPYCRIIPYLVGMLVGYLFHKKINVLNRTRMESWMINAVGWGLATAFALSAVYGPYSVYKEGGTLFSKAENVMYATFSRSAWGLALAWVVYSCHNGYGGQVNKFLSSSYWIPLSRLTYGAYLVHPIILFAAYLSVETPLHYKMQTVVFYFLGTTVLSYASAYILAIFIELPLSNLEKMVFKI